MRRSRRIALKAVKHALAATSQPDYSHPAVRMINDYSRMLERARANALPNLDVPALMALADPSPCEHPYARKVLHCDDIGEVMLATWRSGAACAVHDHGGSGGIVLVLAGRVVETPYGWHAEHGLVAGKPIVHEAGAFTQVGRNAIHSMWAEQAAVTLHLYGPSTARMRVHDLAALTSYVVADGHGAWLPENASCVRAVEPWSEVAARRARAVVLVTYTTHYRDGSEDFARAARTLIAKLAREHQDAEIVLVPIRFKREFVETLAALADDGRTLRELHFVGHSGMYGIMFGSTDWPEQLSPHEWRSLRVPFATDARAVFHACRTGRWFAPFIARTFGISAEGYHGYTTVSQREERFVWDVPWDRTKRPLHVISCVGRKSHGLLGAFEKHVGKAASEPLRRFAPMPADAAPSYDGVAELYDEAFNDLRIRGPEVDFVKHAIATLDITRPLRVLDLGCGNGALLQALGARVGEGIGVDVSQQMIERARARHRQHKHLRFLRITGPELPLDAGSADLVVSFLSFRYLDWDPIVREIERVLSAGGKLVVVDMVDKPIAVGETALLLRSSARHIWTNVRHRAFVQRLQRLTRAPAWAQMLAYNPIRAEHEYRWYLESRFPGRRMQILSASRTARIVAFDSGPKNGSWRLSPMSFP